MWYAAAAHCVQTLSLPGRVLTWRKVSDAIESSDVRYLPTVAPIAVLQGGYMHVINGVNASGWLISVIPHLLRCAMFASIAPFMPIHYEIMYTVWSMRMLRENVGEGGRTDGRTWWLRRKMFQSRDTIWSRQCDYNSARTAGLCGTTWKTYKIG